MESKQKKDSNETVSTRNQAMIWWDTLPTWGNPSKEYYIGLYYTDDNVTPERIEEVWKSEIAERGITITNISKPNQKQFKEPNPLDYNDVQEYRNDLKKYNQKEFKQFDESLFKAYIDKFSDEDKLKMLKVLSLRCGIVIPDLILKGIE